ncbi:DUF1573 domain-containing protein [Bacteroides sp. 224]|uniref:DUF1573 domain-containing protein n=1 Tax=Bacteroides sp. 224 TaxID=2302936 RepID=UPI0013D21B53|nr:DUF1573 domain-containing protein [Bacteroides sp. 224]NDV65170.1 DUF1573 domain-containing protein [Bacteroides sp. 224]
MQFRIYTILLGLMFIALHTGAQNIHPMQYMLDSIANPPLDANPSLVFETNEIRGERLSEDDRPKAYTFSFRNTGDKPLVITQIKSSCGCIVANFEQAPVLPGKQGEITVTYNPKDHPGKFRQRVYVYTDSSDKHPSTRLTISGEVTPTTNKWRDYPVAMGSLRVKRNSMLFRTATHNTSSQAERLECVNSGHSPLRLNAMPGMKPSWLSFRTEPEVIAPGEIADIVVEVNRKLLPPRGTAERIEYSLLLDGINVRPSQRSLRILIEVN